MLLIFRWRRKRKEIWFLCLLTLRQKVLWRITLKLLVEVRKKMQLHEQQKKTWTSEWTTSDHELRTQLSFQKPTQKGDVFYARAAVLATGLMLSFFHVSQSNLGNSLEVPSSQSLQLLHLSMILMDLERFFDPQEAVIIKWIFLQWGDSVGPWERKGGEWEMGIWALISVLLLVLLRL